MGRRPLLMDEVRFAKYLFEKMSLSLKGVVPPQLLYGMVIKQSEVEEKASVIDGADADEVLC